MVEYPIFKVSIQELYSYLSLFITGHCSWWKKKIEIVLRIYNCLICCTMISFMGSQQNIGLLQNNAWHKMLQKTMEMFRMGQTKNQIQGSHCMGDFLLLGSCTLDNGLLGPPMLGSQQHLLPSFSDSDKIHPFELLLQQLRL